MAAAGAAPKLHLARAPPFPRPLPRPFSPPRATQPAQLPAESKVFFYFHSQPEQCSTHILFSVKEGRWPKFG